MAYELIAAVDLGSNSFRLQVGRVLDGQIYPLDALKEPVRLAAGLDADRRLDTLSQQRALDALYRFGERLRGFSPDAVRAVGTNALRVAKNVAAFLPLAEQALGFPIEIIAGLEEARLVYLGAVHSLPPVSHNRLVVDVGGGSTEFVIGRAFVPEKMESLYMGCVSYSWRYFPDTKVNKNAFRAAMLAAAKDIQTITHAYRRCGWQEAVGTSGTAKAIADLLELNQLNPQGVSGVTREGLDRLYRLLLQAGSAAALSLRGLRADRIPVLPGGLAIMMAVFDELGITRMIYADGALRLGVLYDLLGRFCHHDMRDATVDQFMRRYQVDVTQAELVERTSLQLLGQMLTAEDGHQQMRGRFLSWAARLHEIGISVAHSGYHKHGAYILTFADMPGFSRTDQMRLASLVVAHRGKLDRVAGKLPDEGDWCAILALRLAVLLHRARKMSPLPDMQIEVLQDQFVLKLPALWLSHHPLTSAALSDEVAFWQRVGKRLCIVSID